MVIRSALAISIAAVLGAAGCTDRAAQVQRIAQGLQLDVCLSLGTGCCDSDADCSNTATRTETCDTTTHLCVVTSDTTQCNSLNGLLACNDDDLCTVDTCSSNGECVHTPTLLCCLSDVNCDDGNSCTIDTCSIGLLGLAGQCEHTPVSDPLCCNTNADCAGGAVGACGVRTCQQGLLNPWPVCTAVSSGGADCCNTVTDCPTQPCHAASCTAGACVYTPEAGSGCCAVGSDCPVLDVCQLAACTNATCGITVAAAAGCCSAAADCGGGDACHAVSCVANQCQRIDTCSSADGGTTPGCAGGACEPDAGVADMAHASAPTSSADASTLLALRGGGCDVAPTGAANLAVFFIAAALLLVVRRRHA